MYSEQSDVAERVRALMRHLGLRGEIADRDGLEQALDRLKETALSDFDQGEYWGKRRNDIWLNTARVMSALAEVAIMDYRPEGMFEWSEIRAEELRMGMFVEERCKLPDKVQPTQILVVVYAQVRESGIHRALHLEAFPATTDWYNSSLSVSGGLFTPGTIVRAAPGVADRMPGVADPRKEEKGVPT